MWFLLLGFIVAYAEEPRTQRFEFDICVPLEHLAPSKPEPPGGWSNCATMWAKTRADCEGARELAKRRGLTPGPCKEVDDVK